MLSDREISKSRGGGERGGHNSLLSPSVKIWKELSRYTLAGNGTCSGHSCGDGVCIPSDYICDNYLDCHDASDEDNCITSTFDNTFYPEDLPTRCPNSTGLMGMWKDVLINCIPHWI